MRFELFGKAFLFYWDLHLSGKLYLFRKKGNTDRESGN